MKKIFFLLSMCLLVISTTFAHNGLQGKPQTVLNLVAPPAQTLAMTALQESGTFANVFKSVIQQAGRQFYDNNWNSGTQTPNSTEGRRLKFVKFILEGDSKTINFCKSYLITNEFSYTLSDDNQFKAEIRDNFNNNFDILSAAY
jgi:hypothetical protein